MHYKESEKIELKSSLSEWKESIIALCAFANKNGGKVLIGIDDSGKNVGIQIGKGAIEDFANKIKNNTDPVLYPSINVKTFGLGEIIEIEVSESDNKPVFAFERAYTRVGKTSQKLSMAEVRELIKRYAMPDMDQQAVKGMKFDKLEMDEKFEKKLKIYTKNKQEVAYGEYLCLVKKNELFHNAVIKAARFKGVSPVDFIDEIEFDGSLLSAPNKVMAFIQRHINKQIRITGKPEHDEIWDYPLEALREAVMNAIVHRDYVDAGNIQIRIFDDRIEIWSPGLLPKEIKVAEIYREARSVPRNKLIMGIFHKAGLIENWGTGFQRMRQLCLENGNPDPEFSDRSVAFVVSFEKRNIPEKLGEKLGENQIKIIEMLKSNQSITIPELAGKLKISTTAVENNLAKLKEKDLIKRVGPDKGGHWEVL